MNEQITRQAGEIFNAAKDARIPDAVQTFAEDSVVKTRETYNRMSTVAKDGGKVLEEVMLSAQAGAKAIGVKLLDNTVTNTEAAFDAAQKIARAGTFPEAARLQTKFMQQQFVIASEQTKQLFDMYAKVTKQTFDSMSTATAKTFEQIKKAK
jgi:phasin family protein